MLAPAIVQTRAEGVCNVTSIDFIGIVARCAGSLRDPVFAAYRPLNPEGKCRRRTHPFRMHNMHIGIYAMAITFHKS